MWILLKNGQFYFGYFLPKAVFLNKYFNQYNTFDSFLFIQESEKIGYIFHDILEDAMGKIRASDSFDSPIITYDLLDQKVYTGFVLDRRLVSSNKKLYDTVVNMKC